ncbi:MAG: PEGA domain-containing protein [Sedimentisphaerales bacterium]|nr:PEGA domain-containing protein [Sedimentisphaerales bacterium]
MARNCFLAVMVAAVAMVVGGCVERQLTIKTVPAGGVVTLNDEEIGEAPVTVAFEWYGDYNVRVSKEGCETLTTHRKLDRPWHDRFPLDFFAGVVWPGTIKDTYEWTFELKPYQEPSREQLIERAGQLKQQATTP